MVNKLIALSPPRSRRAYDETRRSDVKRQLISTLAIVFGLISGQVGCQTESVEAMKSADREASPTKASLPDLAPKELLRKMEQAYREAKSYSDRGRVVLRYRERGDIVSDEAPLSVVANLPSHLRVEAYYAQVVCDGTKLLAKITDEQSGNIDGQVLNRQLDGDLTLEQVYQNSILREAMTSGMGGQPLQLNLLYSQDPLKSVFATDATCRMLASEELDEHKCYRVVAEGAEGDFVFWIDQTTYVLRRLDFPAESLLPELAQAEFIQDLSLQLEFRDASFAPVIDGAVFKFEMPADAKEVGAFVFPPHPLPTDLFGKRPDSFACYDANGEAITSTSLTEKVAVLIWFNQHPACQKTLQQFGEVYKQRHRDEQVAFFAVSTEPSSVSTEQIQATLDSWGAQVPLLRDLDACGRDKLGVPWTPTMIVFDTAGAIQIFEVGANSNLSEELPTILDRLARGDDLAREVLGDHDAQKTAYLQTLAAAMRDAGEPISSETSTPAVPTLSVPSKAPASE